MGPNGKALAAFGILVLEAPQHAMTLLTAAVHRIPSFDTFDPMTQAALIFFCSTLPASAAAARIVWWVKNQPPEVTGEPASTRILQAP